jgi:hypothetical protein
VHAPGLDFEGMILDADAPVAIARFELSPETALVLGKEDSPFYFAGGFCAILWPQRGRVIYFG